MFNYKITTVPTFNIKNKIIDNIFNIISNIITVDQLGTLNIVFLDQNSIKKLNNNYRGINKATDVLSFHYYDDFSNIKSEEISGEIVMCEDKIISGGKEYKLGSEKEFYYLLIHSILHILGYDHEKENDYKIMGKLEKQIWKEVFEK